MINFDDVYMTYPTDVNALTKINLSVEKGEMIFITGRSGAGKSTLLKLIALVERHTRGRIIINGQNLDRIHNNRIALFRRNISMVFQDHRLLMNKTVFDNVALPMVIAGYRHTDIRKRTQAALDKVGLLPKSNSFPISLSGGEQQRVGIARAVVHRPAILLADEPTGNLDPALSWDTMKLLEQFNRIGMTIVIASHDLERIKAMSKRIYTLSNGNLL